jgi:hypothetical protein
MVGMNRDVLNEDCQIFRRGQIDRMYYKIILARDRITIQGSSNVGIM